MDYAKKVCKAFNKNITTKHILTYDHVDSIIKRSINLYTKSS